jgi:DNA-binding MarR family transcriptional regulator
MKQDIGSATRSDIERVIRALEVFRDLDRGIPLSEILTFLLTASDPEGDTTQQGLADAAGATLSTVNRHLLHLGKWDRNKEPGLELIQQVTSPTNFSKKDRKLTPKGIRVLERFLATLKGE